MKERSLIFLRKEVLCILVAISKDWKFFKERRPFCRMYLLTWDILFGVVTSCYVHWAPEGGSSRRRVFINYRGRRGTRLRRS